MDNLFAQNTDIGGSIINSNDRSPLLDEWLQQHPTMKENQVDRVAGRAATAAETKKENAISIDEVQNVIGWWQKKEYDKLKVDKVRLGEGTVALDLKAPVRRNMYGTVLEMDKQFSFKFPAKSSDWTLTDVQGLKVEGKQIDRITSSADQIALWSGKSKQEFGAVAADFFKALFNPLMRSDLRR